jgi:hypothetical protein
VDYAKIVNRAIRSPDLFMFAVDHLVNNASIWQVCRFEEVDDVNNFRTLMVRNYKPFSVLHTNLGQNQSSHLCCM